ncbi:hypothetical protein DFH07DRAFT_686461, partial [Mycena maculata]
HLGPMEEHTIFEAELVGLILCLVMIANTLRLCSTTILIDNQGAICVVANPWPQPGQHLVQIFHKTLRDLQKKQRTLKLHITWIPGHKDVEGNRAVNTEAKKA